MNSTTSSGRRRSHNNYSSPSFSSSLLEEIYRSFDEDDRENHHHHHHVHHSHQNNNCYSYRKVRINKSSSYMEREIDDDRLRGVNRFVLDEWINENNQRVNLRRNSMAAMNSAAKFNSSSSTSSSDSSSGIGGFSSSDTESFYGSSKSKAKAIPALKPIRTNQNQPEFHRKSYSDEIPAKKNNKEGNFQKKALKIYGDLKKVKQPISPGGKLASFLNSLFNSNSSKKPKISSSSNGLKYSTSTPSTASSYSRSCLSKTPSSAGRIDRRSVRFCPVNTVIAAEDKEYTNSKYNKENCTSQRDKTTNMTTTLRNEELKVQIMEKHRRVEEVAKELLKNYHGRKFQNDGSNNNNNNNNNKSKIHRFDNDNDDKEEDEDEDDDASCCSSDLFELDNLLDDRRYCEELPVYETTHVRTNRAIAKGFIL